MSLVFVLVAALLVALDQATKHLVATAFLPGESRIVIPHLVYVTYVQNTHGAFGLFGNNPLPLAGLAAAVLLGFYFWYRRDGGSSRATHIAFAMILGGAIGNIFDRVRLGYVVDFVDVHVSQTVYWPVFNVADSAITLGVLLLLVRMFAHEPAPTPAE